MYTGMYSGMYTGMYSRIEFWLMGTNELFLEPGMWIGERDLWTGISEL